MEIEQPNFELPRLLGSQDALYIAKHFMETLGLVSKKSKSRPYQFEPHPNAPNILFLCAPQGGGKTRFLSEIYKFAKRKKVPAVSLNFCDHNFFSDLVTLLVEKFPDASSTSDYLERLQQARMGQAKGVETLVAYIESLAAEFEGLTLLIDEVLLPVSVEFIDVLSALAVSKQKIFVMIGLNESRKSRVSMKTDRNKNVLFHFSEFCATSVKTFFRTRGEEGQSINPKVHKLPNPIKPLVMDGLAYVYFLPTWSRTIIRSYIKQVFPETLIEKDVLDHISNVTSGVPGEVKSVLMKTYHSALKDNNLPKVSSGTISKLLQKEINNILTVDRHESHLPVSSTPPDRNWLEIFDLKKCCPEIHSFVHGILDQSEIRFSGNKVYLEQGTENSALLLPLLSQVFSNQISGKAKIDCYPLIQVLRKDYAAQTDKNETAVFQEMTLGLYEAELDILRGDYQRAQQTLGHMLLFLAMPSSQCTCHLKSKAYLLLGTLFRVQAKVNEAITYFEQCLLFDNLQKDDLLFAKASLLLCQLETLTSEHEVSTMFDQLNQLQKELEALNPILAASVRGSLGRFYLVKSETHEAKKYLREAAEVYAKLGDQGRYVRCHLGLGKVLFKEQGFQEAIAHFSLVLEVADQALFFYERLNALELIVRCHFQLNQLKEFSKYCSIYCDYCIENGEVRRLGRILETACHVYLKLGLIKKADTLVQAYINSLNLNRDANAASVCDFFAAKLVLFKRDLITENARRYELAYKKLRKLADQLDDSEPRTKSLKEVFWLYEVDYLAREKGSAVALGRLSELISSNQFTGARENDACLKAYVLSVEENQEKDVEKYFSQYNLLVGEENAERKLAFYTMAAQSSLCRKNTAKSKEYLDLALKEIEETDNPLWKSEFYKTFSSYGKEINDARLVKENLEIAEAETETYLRSWEHHDRTVFKNHSSSWKNIQDLKNSSKS